MFKRFFFKFQEGISNINTLAEQKKQHANKSVIDEFRESIQRDEERIRGLKEAQRREGIFDNNAIYKRIVDVEVPFLELLTNMDITKIEQVRYSPISQVHKFVESYIKR